MKHLIIQHFGPIENVDIKLKRFNVILGPQSSGKSTLLKVACFCDWMERQIVMLYGSPIRKKHEDLNLIGKLQKDGTTDEQKLHTSLQKEIFWLLFLIGIKYR